MKKDGVGVYKLGDPMCPECGCNPICICHYDDGRGGCVECGICKLAVKAE